MDNELFGERHEQEENGLFGKRHEIKRIADILYNAYVLEGWKNVSEKQCELWATSYLETKDILNRVWEKEN